MGHSVMLVGVHTCSRTGVKQAFVCVLRGLCILGSRLLDVIRSVQTHSFCIFIRPLG